MVPNAEAGHPEQKALSEAAERERRLNLATVILLALSLLGSAWCAYQASLWGGRFGLYFDATEQVRLDALQKLEQIGTNRQIDLQLYVAWLNAEAQGNREVANLLRERFADRFRPLFDEWLAAREPGAERQFATGSPFDAPAYQRGPRDAVGRLQKQAETLSSAANEANRLATRYVLPMLLFASVLGFCGIGAQLPAYRARAATMWIAALALALGAAMVIVLTTESVRAAGWMPKL